MNPFYTDETKIIYLNSFDRVGNNSANAIMDMGHHLNNEYEFYHCQVIDYWGDSHNLAGSRLGNFEAFDFMESSYTTTNKYNGQTICAGVTFNSGIQYRQTEMYNRFVVKNFNGKRIRFAITRGDGAYNGNDFGGGVTDGWTLLLALTPIKNEPQYYIQSKFAESFTYCINSSIAKIDPASEIHNCDFLLNPISSEYNEFFVDVRIIQHTNRLQTVVDEYINIFISDWSEDYPERQFIGSVMCLGSGASSFNSNKGADNAVFKVKNMKQAKRVKFEMLRINGSRPTLLFDTDYIIHFSCLFTPIK